MGAAAGRRVPVPVLEVGLLIRGTEPTTEPAGGSWDCSDRQSLTGIWTPATAYPGVTAGLGNCEAVCVRMLTVLGGTGAYPEPGQACSGFLIDWDGFRVVLDLGYATLPRLLAHVPDADVDAVVITTNIRIIASICTACSGFAATAELPLDGWRSTAQPGGLPVSKGWSPTSTCAACSTCTTCRGLTSWDRSP